MAEKYISKISLPSSNGEPVEYVIKDPNAEHGTNVKFQNNIVATSPFGRFVPDPATGSVTIEVVGMTIEQGLNFICCEEKEPTVSYPYIYVTLSDAGEKEVGTTFTPSYTIGTNAGSYTYGPDTGVTFSDFSATDSKGVEQSGQSGNFTEFVVSDNTDYYIASASASHTDGTTPNTNMGKASTKTSGISAGSKSCGASSSVKGYRKWFMYVGESLGTIDSAFIRASTNKGNGKYASTQSKVNIPQGTKRVMVAIPAGDGYTKMLTSVIDVDGMGLDIFSKFVLSDPKIKVSDARGGVENQMEYNVWTFENASGIAASHFDFVIS